MTPMIQDAPGQTLRPANLSKGSLQLRTTSCSVAAKMLLQSGFPASQLNRFQNGADMTHDDITVVLGIPIPSADSPFLAIVGVHVLFGLSAVVIGAVAMLSRK